MPEYIEREAVLKSLNRNSITKKLTLADGESIYNTIEKIPTADVVEVVRCKACECFSPKTNFCRCHDTPIYEDDFCSYGERKEE